MNIVWHLLKVVIIQTPPGSFLQSVKVVDIARRNDPWPMWMAFVPGAQAFKMLYGNPEAGTSIRRSCTSISEETVNQKNVYVKV